MKLSHTHTPTFDQSPKPTQEVTKKPAFLPFLFWVANLKNISCIFSIQLKLIYIAYSWEKHHNKCWKICSIKAFLTKWIWNFYRPREDNSLGYKLTYLKLQGCVRGFQTGNDLWRVAQIMATVSLLFLPAGKSCSQIFDRISVLDISDIRCADRKPGT